MSDNALLTLLDALPMSALVVSGTNFRVNAASPMAQSVFGADVMDRPLAAIVRVPVLLAAVELAFESGTRQVVVFNINAQSRDITLQATISPLQADLAQAFLILFEDQTEVIAAVSMRRDFVANVSHELRTPLTALLGFIETLQGPAEKDPAARSHFLSIMQGEAGRMARLVDRLLSLSRVEEEERRRPKNLVDIVEVAVSGVQVLDELANKANVDVRIVAPDPVPPIFGDPEQLRQVVLNLVENALKYGAAGGRVDIRIGVNRAGQVTLEIQDFGDGIEAHHLSRLTERFYRVDSHRSREMGGTGLGLAIVKHIVNRHRGTLQFASTLGQGTTVTLCIPVASQ